eukprot:Gb_09365 [translate_table: standard]
MDPDKDRTAYGLQSTSASNSDDRDEERASMLDSYDSNMSDFRLFPASIKYLVWNEFCERFSFYGMKTILALFLLERLGLTEVESTESVHLFIVVCYATPVFGAIISDTVLGKYHTVFYLSLLYAFGNWIMSAAAVPGLDPVSHKASNFAVWGTAAGLLLIATGTGGIKPCVAAFGGDQIEYSLPEGHIKNRLRMRFFSLYYFAINAGSFVSTVLTPVLRADLSYAVAFGVPAVLMIVAVFIFWLGHGTYIDRPPMGNVFSTVAKVIIDSIRLRKTYTSRTIDVTQTKVGINGKVVSIIAADGRNTFHWLDPAKLSHGSQDVEDVKALLHVLFLLLPAPLFWSLFDQQSSKWVFQARQMSGYVPWLGNLVIQPDQMQALNPVLILILIPLFDQFLYPSLEKHRVSLKPIRRMIVGMLLCAIAFLISGVVQIFIDGITSSGRSGSSAVIRSTPEQVIGTEKISGLVTGPTQISMLWQIPQYVVMTTGEVLFSVTGLEFAYSQAPHSMKSVIQSAWLSTVAAGNLVTVALVAIIGNSLSRSNTFFFFAGGCIVAMLLMVWVSANFKYREHLDDEDEEVLLAENAEAEATMT